MYHATSWWMRYSIEYARYSISIKIYAISMALCDEIPCFSSFSTSLIHKRSFRGRSNCWLRLQFIALPRGGNFRSQHKRSPCSLGTTNLTWTRKKWDFFLTWKNSGVFVFYEFIVQKKKFITVPTSSALLFFEPIFNSGLNSDISSELCSKITCLNRDSNYYDKICRFTWSNRKVIGQLKLTSNWNYS